MAKTQTAVKTLVAALANVSKTPAKAMPIKADVADKLTQAATMAGNAASYPYLVKNIVAELRKAKVTIGNRKADGTGCPMAQLYWDTFKALAKTTAGKPFTDDNCNKWLGAFKRMVNDGAKFDLNLSQTKAREAAKAAKAAAAANPAAPAAPGVNPVANVSSDPKAPSTPVVTTMPTSAPSTANATSAAPAAPVQTPGVSPTLANTLAMLANYTVFCREASGGEQSKIWKEVLVLYPQLAKLITHATRK